MKHSFGSDNHSGVHPLIMEAIVEQNKDFATAYGNDNYTLEVLGKIEKLLGGNCKAFFVFNGTGANVTALYSLLKSYQCILAPSTAHINVDECGAPEKITGSKIIPIPSKDGKISCEDIIPFLTGFGDQHHTQPKVLSISQPTELGTLYSTQEIRELANLIHSVGGYLHMDGSRVSNAASSLNLSIKEFTVDCGVDVLSYGGTKNGLLMGEAVVFFNNNAIAEEFSFCRKQSTQLYSKSRFIAAQFDAYLKDDLYLKMASHSNEMAKYLAESLQDFKEVKISRPVESNVVFAIISKNLTEYLLKNNYFYVWDESTNEVRWMCSFNTKREDIDVFVSQIQDFYSSVK